MGEKLAFIGLGVMGGNLARRLVEAGHELTVFTPTTAKAEAFARNHGAKAAPNPAAAAAEAACVFMCVGNDDHVLQMAEGPTGVFSAMAPGSILVDHSTVSAALARGLSREASRRRLGFLDAPVSGGEKGAQEGTLTVMVGGHPDHFERVKPLLAAYSKTVRLLGPAGSGQLAKMVNQICIAGVLQGLAEGLHFAELAGLDASDVVQVISQGAAQSWQMDNRHTAMLDGKFDFGFAVDWMRKDLALALDEARRNGARLPVAALVDQFYADVQALGGARWDTSSLITRLRTESGLKRP